MHFVLLHCPTGHLSAAVCGMSAGLLPADRFPPVHELRGYFRQAMHRRRYGQLNPIPRQPYQSRDVMPNGNRLLSMARGTEGPVIDTALAQFSRLVGGAATLQAGPAIRPRKSVAGLGALPTPIQTQHRPVVSVLLWAARLGGNLGLHSLADLAGALAAQRCYPELAARASALPAVSVSAISEGGALAECRDRVVYHCFGAAHSSVVAASLHRGILPMQGQVACQDIRMVPAFDSRSGSDIGRAVYYGQDDKGCAVFVIGFNGSRQLLTQAYQDLLAMVSARPKVVMVETLDSVSLLVRIGGYLSRRWRLVRIGRPLTVLGIAWSISALRAVVGQAQTEINSKRC